LFYSSPILLKIFSEGPFFKVRAPLALLEIDFTGVEAIVRGSPFHFGRTCGLCGDFNGEHLSEFRAPTQAVLKKPEHMAISYMIPGPQCDAEAIKRRYGYIVSTACKYYNLGKLIKREKIFYPKYFMQTVVRFWQWMLNSHPGIYGSPVRQRVPFRRAQLPFLRTGAVAVFLLPLACNDLKLN
jgi:hypothetical protein